MYPISSRNDQAPRWKCTLLGLTFAFCFPIATAQTANPKAAEIQSHLERAQAALKSNTPAVAAEEFGAILALDPKNAEAHANLGVLAFFHGDCAAAEPEFRSALKTAPSMVKAEALLAICEKRLGQPSAEAQLELAFSKLQDVKLRTQVGTELADLYYQQGDLDKTAEIMRTLVAIAPDNVDILFFAQRVYSELADETLNKLALLAPASARMEQLIAERLINAGDAQDAVTHYKKALEMNPRLPGVHFELAEAIVQSSPQDPHALADAQNELTAAANVDGDNSTIEYERGEIALKQFDDAQALVHFKQAYAMNPKDVNAEMGMATVLKMQDKPEEAIGYLRMALAADPMNAEAHYQLGLVCRQLHLTDEAQKEVQLYKEVKAAKDRVKDVYREMNPRAVTENDTTPAARPQ
jgi:tetratricopeptide (TPR) repeat protein